MAPSSRYCWPRVPALPPGGQGGHPHPILGLYLLSFIQFPPNRVGFQTPHDPCPRSQFGLTGKAVGTPIPASAFTDNFRQTDRQRMEHPSRILGQMGTIESAEGMFWPSQPSQNRLALVCPRAV